MGRWMDRVRSSEGVGVRPPAPAPIPQSSAELAATVSALTSADLYDIRHTPPTTTGPFRAWYHRNTELLTEADRQLGHDPGGFCGEHRRWLSYPEQKRGACAWCVPVDHEREPEYWASHWRKFMERRP